MRRLPILLMSLLVAFAAQTGAARASGTIGGGSAAKCNPSPCTHPHGYTMVTLANVSNDNGTTSTRSFAVYRPGGLTPSPSNRAPAVLYFYPGGNCGLINPGRFIGLSTVDRFFVVAMEVPCGRNNNWSKRNVDSAGLAVPDDEPYVSAVAHAISHCPASGVAPYQCADPQRLYAVGSSSGGNMVADVMCDAQNSSLFRGYLIDSSSIELFSGSPHCPTTNRSFFVMMALSNYGIDRFLYYNLSPNPHLDTSAFADWAATRLGCPRRRDSGAIGSPQATTLTYTYHAACAYATGGAAVRTLGVQNGDHTFGCQDSDPNATPYACRGIPNPPGLSSTGLPKTNGLFVEQDFWTFVEQGYSTTSRASPYVDTTPPTVRVSSPAPGTAASGRVRISAAATDDLGVASVQFQLDGANLGASGSVDANGAYSLSWDTATGANGTHVLKAIARDAAGNRTASAPVTVVVQNGSATPATARWVSLGDSLSAGDGIAPYLAGSNVPGDRCHRSDLSFANLDAEDLGIPGDALALRACSGAGIAQLSARNRRNHEPAQLQWVGKAAQVVTVSIGWTDALLPKVLEACVFGASTCKARWQARVRTALGRLAGSSAANPLSLYRLYRRIARAAPSAKVLVLGYPRLFPPRATAPCASGIPGRMLSPSVMRWVNTEIGKLDALIKRAAGKAQVTYVPGSDTAFAGHTLCTAKPYVSGAALAAGRRRALGSTSFLPNVLGQQWLAQLVAGVD